MTASAPLTVDAWLRLVYALGFHAAQPREALERLGDLDPARRRDPAVGCAIGDVDAVAVLAADPVRRDAPLAPLRMPPLVAVTFSSLLTIPQYAERLRACVHVLLDAGASVDATWVDDKFPDSPLGALYGAAGRNHDLSLTQLLLARGANPNDNESVYHATEAPTLDCLRALLDAGARVTGTNATFHVLDREDPDGLRLLLQKGGDPNERMREFTPLAWAIRRRRSLALIDILLDAGADPRARDAAGCTPLQLARRAGLERVAARLVEVAGDEPVDAREAFIVACASANEGAARAALAESPNLMRDLAADDLRLLPDCVETRRDDAVRLMVTLGWPIDARGGDWNASALNLAVFRGDASLTRFLLEHGADWRETHGYGDNVLGTLHFAAVARPAHDGDWLACATVLLDHGMPVPPADDARAWPPPITVLFADRRA